MNCGRVLPLIGALPFAMSGCGPSSLLKYRYKLFLELITPDGPKSAFSVIEVIQGIHWYENSLSSGVNGEALYLDLGPKLPPLVALLGARVRDGGDTYWGGRTLLEPSPSQLGESSHGSYSKSRDGPKGPLPNLAARHSPPQAPTT